MTEENDSIWDKVVVCADAIMTATDSNETAGLISKLAAQFEQLDPDDRDDATRAVHTFLMTLIGDRARWQTPYREELPPAEDE